MCKQLNVTLNNEFVSVLEFSSNDLEILKRRLYYLQIDNECYVSGNICKTHKDEYFKWYKLRQRTCCDPLNIHPGTNRTKALKTISLKLSDSNPRVLIQGKNCVLRVIHTITHQLIRQSLLLIITLQSKALMIKISVIPHC